MKVIGLNDRKAWEEATALIHVPFYKWEYARAFSYMGRPKLLVSGDEYDFTVMPIITRKIRGTKRVDITSPYGYSGPVRFGEPAKSNMAKEFEQYLIAKDPVSVFLRFNPMLRNEKFFPWMDEAGDTVYVDLDVYPEGMSKNCRNAISHAERSRCWVAAFSWAGKHGLDSGGSWNLPSWCSRRDHVNKFIQLYQEAMERKGAANRHVFPGKTLKQLAKMDECVIFFAYTPLQAGPVAASMFLASEGNKTAYYYLAASVKSMFPGINNMVIDSAAKFFRKAGFKRLCLGEGLSGMDSLFGFKASFSKLRSRYFTNRAILDIMEYRRLTLGKTGSYFPLYRSEEDA